MLDKKDLQVGALVWWTADRIFKSWSCPAIVTQVKKKSFKVRSLDDFKESAPLRMDDDMDQTSRREMRLASLEEVCCYLRDQMRVLDEACAKREQADDQAKRRYDEYLAKVGQFLPELTASATVSPPA